MADEKKPAPPASPALVNETGPVPMRVVIGCKLPHGLAIDAETTPQRNPTNGELVDSGERDLTRRVILKGMDSLDVRGPDGNTTGIMLPDSGGYGITVLEGWQAEAWRDWYSRHRDFPAVKRGLIFEVPTEQDAKAEGMKRRDLKSGADRLDPNKLPQGIQKADEK